MLDRVHYIIPYRESTEARKSALIFVLKWLECYLPEVDILIIEQDSVPRLNIPLPGNCQRKFLYNKGLYNKGWSLNWAARFSDKEILAIADADVFLERTDYLTCFSACLEFESVSPHRDQAVNVDIVDLSTLSFKTKDCRNLYVFAAMFFVIQREVLLHIGGWDERFEGWGGEDDAISHLIVNSIDTRIFDFTLYHIDHERQLTDGPGQPNYEFNEILTQEILTLNGPALGRYREKLVSLSLGDPEKYRNPSETYSGKVKFILAVTTYNRVSYFRQFIETWLETRNKEAEWALIIADDGSTDGTLGYIASLDIPGTTVTLIQNNRKDITHQTNSIIRAISTIDFDLCFKCDDDITFLKQGWDDLYWELVQRTGYEHFCFYDRKWKPEMDLDIPVKIGGLICHSKDFIQGALFTITPNIIREVGYFDRFNLGFRGYEHNDYTLRCCRAGFNSIEHPFDVDKSNEYLALQPKDGYYRAIPNETVFKFNTKEEFERKKLYLRQNRIYIPFSQDNNSLIEFEAKGEQTKKSIMIYKLADGKFYPERGVRGLLGTLLKRSYNFFLRRNWFWYPKILKKTGLLFIKIGEDFRNIDQ